MATKVYSITSAGFTVSSRQIIRPDDRLVMSKTSFINKLSLLLSSSTILTFDSMRFAGLLGFSMLLITDLISFSIILINPRIDVNGVRSSCDTVAVNVLCICAMVINLLLASSVFFMAKSKRITASLIASISVKLECNRSDCGSEFFKFNKISRTRNSGLTIPFTMFILIMTKMLPSIKNTIIAAIKPRLA